MKKYWKIILLVVIVVGAAVAWYGSKEYNRKPKGAGEMKAEFEMTAADLTTAFGADEAGSNTKYNDKPMLISGTVRTVEKDDKGVVTVTLVGDGDMSNVICTMGAEETEAANLKEGDAVKIQGFCNGAQTMLGTDVLMNRCALKK